MDGSLDLAARTFAKRLAVSSQDGREGYLIVNPLSFARRVAVEAADMEFGVASNNVIAADVSGGISRAIVELPAMGFAWLAGTETRARADQPRVKSRIAVDYVLQNAFCEVAIHPETGGVQSIRDLRTHGNRLSQQLAIRMPQAKGEDGPAYSTMVANLIEVEVSDSVIGRIRSAGALVAADGRKLADFAQLVTLWAGSRVIEVEIEIGEIAVEYSSDPWESYLAARFAWGDASSLLRRGVHGCRFDTDAECFEAPEYVEIVSGDLQTTILSGGLPYSKRSGARTLDTLLGVKGEQSRRFHLGIGIDIAHSWRAAQEFVTPATSVRIDRALAGSQAASGWLFHIDAANVGATHWEAICEDGRVSGFRVRLLETEGLAGEVKLRSFKPIATAQSTDFSNQPERELKVDSEAVSIEIKSYEWRQIEVRFAD